jgi:hypothetical protein
MHSHIAMRLAGSQNYSDFREAIESKHIANHLRPRHSLELQKCGFRFSQPDQKADWISFIKGWTSCQRAAGLT